MKVHCALCNSETEKKLSAVNRAKRIGASIYCNRTCAGLGRRKNKTDDEKREAKRLYDIAYREKNLDEIKSRQAEYFQRTYDPESAAIKRKENMPRHVEYCRRPEYRKWKSEYDRQYRAKNEFGEFWEVALIVADIDKEVSERMSRQEISQTNGTFNKAQHRRREYERTNRNKS